MYRSGDYTIALVHANGSRTVALGTGAFDCNDQSHWICLDETGSVRDLSATTLLRCETPTG
ncbi:hypothetical protein [Halorientalis pallida]|uniref:Uncharacterized protein n=1 Tax=Halorientalis pallida TaxID=2479928 RepID=A0A498L1P2_9EURY|nr:hypothetical protein [Halorientalis pallida]RXK52007.1 hypothetical protein EAF64_05085 [Halorientalis pallida]